MQTTLTNQMTSQINPIAFCNNISYILKHNSSCLCRDCISECASCGEFITDSEDDNCKECSNIIKKEMLQTTCNDITSSFPPELVNMILNLI